MKTPIAYYGGKQRLASRIVKLMPKHTVYVEPFCGGAAVLFAKPFPDVGNSDHYREVINDTNARLVNLWRQIRNNPDFAHQVLSTPYSREEHRLARSPSGDPVEDARRYLIDLRMSFANESGAGWGTNVYKGNLAAGWHECTRGMHGVMSRLKAVSIECDDALKVIKRWDSPQTLFYCDPPYIDTEQGHYSGYTKDDLQNLVDALDKAQGSFLLSGYPNEIAPKSWDKVEFEFTSSAKGSTRKSKTEADVRTNTKRAEVVWRRGPRVQPRPEILKLYASGKYDCFEWEPG